MPLSVQQGLRFLPIPNGCTSVSLGNFPSNPPIDYITFEAWVTVPVITSALQMIIGGNPSGDYLCIHTSGSAFLSCQVSGTQRTLIGAVIPLGTPTHVIGTFDGNNIKVYVNGILTATSPSYPGTLNINSSYATGWRLGQFISGSNSYPFGGTIHTARIYNRALSDAEVAANYNGQVTSDGLVGEWLMNEGQGTTVHDTSGNGNDGTITGATWAIKKAGTVQAVEFTGVKNLFDYTKALPSSFIYATDGTVGASSGWYASDYIPVQPGVTYVANISGPSGVAGCAYYDRFKRYISGTAFGGNGSQTMNVPYNAYYLRTSHKVSNSSTVQVEKGSTATQFEPYTLVPDNKAVPITGRKNLLDPSAWVNGRIFDSNFMLTSFTVDTVNNVVTGYASGSGMVSQKVNVTPYTDYTFNGVPDNVHAATFYVYDLAGNQIVISSAYPHTFNTGANNQIIFSLYKPGSNTTAYMDISNPQLEIGVSATTFEPYIAVPNNKPAAR